MQLFLVSSWKFSLENVSLLVLLLRSCRKFSWVVMGTTNCCEFSHWFLLWGLFNCLQCLRLAVALSLWALSIMSVRVSVIGYINYGIIFGSWIMATQIQVYSATYSYLIQLPMWLIIKVLKYVNRYLHSSQKITNETGETLCDHFWCGICKFDTLFSIIYLLLISCTV